MLDKTEFEITVDETLEEIERRIENHAIDGVELTNDAGILRLQFDDGFHLAIRGDAELHRLICDVGSDIMTFAYNEVVEQWLSGGEEQELLAMLSAIVSSHVGRAIDLGTE